MDPVVFQSTSTLDHTVHKTCCLITHGDNHFETRSILPDMQGFKMTHPPCPPSWTSLHSVGHLGLSWPWPWKPPSFDPTFNPGLHQHFFHPGHQNESSSAGTFRGHGVNSMIHLRSNRCQDSWISLGQSEKWGQVLDRTILCIHTPEFLSSWPVLTTSHSTVSDRTGAVNSEFKEYSLCILNVQSFLACFSVPFFLELLLDFALIVPFFLSFVTQFLSVRSNYLLRDSFSSPVKCLKYKSVRRRGDVRARYCWQLSQSRFALSWQIWLKKRKERWKSTN